jgi:hypothetical protein
MRRGSNFASASIEAMTCRIFSAVILTDDGLFPGAPQAWQWKSRRKGARRGDLRPPPQAPAGYSIPALAGVAPGASRDSMKQGTMNMTNDQTNNLPVAGDGFEITDNDDKDRVIQGSIIRCVDGEWTDGDGEPFPPDTPLLVLATTMALQHWKNKEPIETIMKQPGQPLPDVDELNKKIPKKEWEPGLDKTPRPPWGIQHICYLLNPRDAGLHTFINGTVGARIAVDRLKTKVVFMRRLRGANVVPLVKLDTKPMKTKFGPKQRPEFTILEWRQLGSDASAMRTIEHHPDDCAGLDPVEPVTVEEEMDDYIPHR